MSEVSRRKLFAGFAAAPFLGALAARGEETGTRTGAAVAPAHKFAPASPDAKSCASGTFPTSNW